MTTDPEPREVPVIPPDYWVAAVNAEAMKNGQPFRSALDPLMLFSWSLANRPLPPMIIGLSGV